MNFGRQTGVPIGAATSAKYNENKKTNRLFEVLGVLGKRSEQLEATRLSFVLFWHRWASTCSLCNEMITRR
jgi:hypothetical protein